MKCGNNCRGRRRLCLVQLRQKLSIILLLALAAAVAIIFIMVFGGAKSADEGESTFDKPASTTAAVTKTPVTTVGEDVKPTEPEFEDFYGV